jgi:hypothetical protein
MLIDTKTYIYTSNTNNTGVRDVRFMLSKFICYRVYRFILLGQKYDNHVSMVAPEPFFTYPSGSPVKEPSLQISLAELP